MAKVAAKVFGGSLKEVEANTVRDAFNALGLSGNYTASINGEPADMDDHLSDESFVSFAASVKGGA